MAKVQSSGNDFCPQSLFLYGNYEENGTPHFGLFCWFSYCWLDSGLGVMACIGEEKTTKDLIRKTGVFSANLVNEPLLPLADYYGSTSGRENPDKMKRLPTIERGRVLNVPLIAESPVNFELKVLSERNLSPGCDLFVCRAENALMDERLKDQSLPVIERMKIAQPVSTVAESTYVNFFGQELGKWGGIAKGAEAINRPRP
ncbi:flavin reductase [Acutalibacter sp. 1XD8-33]|uniref:flavin reductase family protein n=1 Tax=Acutalibacter sp. 1XD8-33 TaxID=2320081 RepID=UPI000EA0CF71|nr:flavin reductase [Acutalibacter sp. 1XD8-33]RKJ41460.1 flavin reductase [Acutalibacter sp. 1XD8-33]